MTPKHTRTLKLLIGLLLFAAAPLKADERSDRARAAFEKGQAHYNLDEFDDAIREFQEAYRNRPLPIFLYDIAQAARLSQKPELALRYYEKYARFAPHAPNIAEVRQRITALKRLVAEQSATTHAQPRTPLAPEPSSTREPLPIPEAASAAAAKLEPSATATSASPSIASAPNPAAPAPSHVVVTEPVVPPVAPGTPPSASAAPTPRPPLSPSSTALSQAPAAPDSTLTHIAEPASRPSARPVYKRWWLWTIVGTVAAGGATALALTLNPSSPALPNADYGPIHIGSK